MHPFQTSSACLLAIETSCDDTSVAVLQGHRVLSNVTYSQAIHEKYGGVVPELASREHDLKISLCLQEALQQANTKISDLDAIAVTQGPGLMGSLLVGLNFAKGLALQWNKPLMGIDHMDAHIYANFIEHPEISYPFLGLVVSGGHSRIIRVDAPFEEYILGETRDDAAGEAFDKSGKLLGLPYPAGPQMDRLSKDGDPSFLKLPIGLKNEGLDFSFSGLKTAVLYALEDAKKAHGEAYIQQHIADFCASISHAITEALVLKTQRALKQHTDIKSILLAGGVSANSMLRKKMHTLSNQFNLPLYYPALSYCTDNAAMIGITAQIKAKIMEYPSLNESLSLQAYARQTH